MTRLLDHKPGEVGATASQLAQSGVRKATEKPVVHKPSRSERNQRLLASHGVVYDISHALLLGFRHLVFGDSIVEESASSSMLQAETMVFFESELQSLLCWLQIHYHPEVSQLSNDELDALSNSLSQVFQNTVVEKGEGSGSKCGITYKDFGVWFRKACERILTLRLATPGTTADNHTFRQEWLLPAGASLRAAHNIDRHDSQAYRPSEDFSYRHLHGPASIGTRDSRETGVAGPTAKGMRRYMREHGGGDDQSEQSGTARSAALTARSAVSGLTGFRGDQCAGVESGRSDGDEFGSSQ
jgi:hypothetical protein